MLAKITAAVLAFIYSIFGISSTKNISLPQVTPTPAVNITISTPQQNSQLNYILEIRGQARVFENQFQWRLTDANHKVLVSGISSSDASDSGQFGNYFISTSYKVPPTRSGFVEVYDSSPKDGAETDLVSIPVLFPSGETREIYLYFGQLSPDSSMQSCEARTPVKRIILSTPAVAAAALEQLLSGPTTEEAKHVIHSINQGVTLNKLTIVNGIARADFNDRLNEQIAGSCKVTAIRSQITNTLKQFPSVNQVIISVNGRTSDILQP